MCIYISSTYSTSQKISSNGKFTFLINLVCVTFEVESVDLDLCLKKKNTQEKKCEKKFDVLPRRHVLRQPIV